jgi:hypothetical protein
MTHGPRRSLLAATLAAIALLVSLVSPAAAGGPKVTVIADGLDNPRGIAVGRDGRIFVAAAGKGGSGIGGYGTSGKIIVIRDNHDRTYRGRLPSIISPEGEASGPVNVAVRDGRVYALIGGGPKDLNKKFGTLVRVSREHVRIVADIAGYQATDPDPTDLDQPPNPFDSNPYGIAPLKHGRTLVADAGGNDLLLVTSNGKVVTVARFPNQVISTDFLPPLFGVPPGLEFPAEAVPTSVAVGPDGYWYVGELKGFPFTPGTSRIWRVAPWARDVTCDATAPTRKCSLFMDGFTSVVGLAWGKHRTLYVVEMVKTGVANFFGGVDSVGALWKVKGGVKTELVPGQLTLPGGVAVSRSGKIYVTNQSVSVGGGEVLRIRP